ncbi:histone acetyltransferase type B catalytic subunit [Bacillus rossius redtenbacheri]|uniref:histone acetyltransferase type B catalytic subunit n=1 Tax=Bacillus rossius redtenbacheri TaxID=93214 RepID=UPI002FDDBCD3
MIAIAKSAVNSFVTDSNEALELKLVRDVSDLENETTTFKPEMSHQIFGESESIFGYRDLKIKLYYTAAKLTTYLGISYSEVVDPKKCEGIEPDDVGKLIAEKLQPGFHTNLDDFCNDLAKDVNFTPFGQLERSFKTKGNENSPPKCYEVYFCDITNPGFASFHERLQTFILWYIDAASFIDVDDENWRFFVMYEKYLQGGSARHAVVGYMSLYQYFAYPLNIRPRISQMLVLPPFQGRGLGTELLRTVYQHYVAEPSVLDITVEDPSERFQRLRDFVDVANCSMLDAFRPEELHAGFKSSMVEEARRRFRINKKQCRRVYEILRLKHTNIQDARQYQSYRLAVKQRLNVPYKKEMLDRQKLKKLLDDFEYEATVTFSSAAQRMEHLEQQYREVEAEYRHVLDRLEDRG